MSNNLGKFFSDNYLLVIIAIVVVVVMFYPKLSEGFGYGNTKCYRLCRGANNCESLVGGYSKRCDRNCDLECKSNSSAYPKTVTPPPPPPPPIVTESSTVTDS
jgi:hypothetical protein